MENSESQSASSASTAKHNLLRGGLKSQLTSSAPTTNHRRHLREGLETQPASTASTSLVIDSNISEVTGLSIEPSETGYSLWRGHCCRSGIKDSIPAAQSLYKYTWEVVTCMFLTGKGRLGPDIWPETLKQAESTKDMMRSIWGKEAYQRCKPSGTKSCPLSLSGKEARFIGPPYCYGHPVANWNIDFRFYHRR